MTLKRPLAFSRIFALILLTAMPSSGCPDSCICKWKNGKQTVECVNKDLLIIPDGMDSGTQVLEFSGNNLHVLQREKFLKMDLINLQRIYLSKCRIANIDDRTFKGLTNLIELDLSGNLLEFIPSDAFADCPSLMKLTLSSNPVKSIKRMAFYQLGYLNTLEISFCDITKVEIGAFDGLTSLEYLSLNGNKLTTIKGKKIFPDSLKLVALQDNPWECDCHMTDLHTWINNFNLPHNVQPICRGPARLQGKTIKSIQSNDLACLPDVSPTTFFLEIGEGKNISLLCHVSAIPEARVTWWFQGQLLQNDSLIAPGLRLLYYIEEGREQKKSELFIYNTNAEDNGTFVCSAENAAGVIHSNYTIRVILKQEPNYDVVTLPFEIVIIIVSAASVTLLILVLIIILSIVKCCRDRKLRKKREREKSLSNSSKDILTQESTEELSESSKESSNVLDRQQMLFYTAALPTSELIKPMSPVIQTNQIRSPASLRRFQLEQNPDLINDTETGGRRKDGDGKDVETGVENFEMQSSGMVEVKASGTLRRSARDLYRLSADVHLTPVGLLNSTENRGQYTTGNCYRTLPYNRAGKRQSAANPATRFSREAEFLSQSIQPAPYEHFCEDVRYTADGYPVRPIQEISGHLIDPRLVDPNLRLIDQNGRIVDQNGRLIDQSGCLIDANGLIVDQNGRQIDPTGRLIDSGRLIDQSGRLLDQSGRLLDTAVRLDPSGRILDPSGRLVDPSGRLIDPSARLIDPTTCLVDPTGCLVDPTGCLVDPTGCIIDPRMVDPADSSSHSSLTIPTVQQSAPIQWPPCLPGKLSRGPSLEEAPKVKKSVGAQTQTDSEDTKAVQGKALNKSLCSVAKVGETLTESPDEGYEGESVETCSNTC